MKRLVVPVVGTGDQGDPFRVNLPTYTLLQIDPVRKLAVVDVPDEDFPPGFVLPSLAAQVNGSAGQDLSKLSAGARAIWYAHLDGRYVEHAGAFRPV